MPKYNFPGTKSYGNTGPLTKKEMDEIPMRNKDIQKVLDNFKVGPSGHAYDKNFVKKMKSQKTTA